MRLETDTKCREHLPEKQMLWGLLPGQPAFGCLPRLWTPAAFPFDVPGPWFFRGHPEIPCALPIPCNSLTLLGSAFGPGS